MGLFPARRISGQIVTKFLIYLLSFYWLRFIHPLLYIDFDALLLLV